MRKIISFGTTVAFAAVFGVTPASARPVVVELFTSQGCSSCPDADRVLSTWGQREFAAGRVLPLSFDVDYWDYLGWKDVFSTPAWSNRQARYAAALRSRTYTPQMVVAGREAFVGSDSDRAAASVRLFADEPPRAEIGLAVLSSPRVRLHVSVAPTAKAAGLHAVLVLFESGLVTEVSRGENGGRSLRNDFVVRRLVDLGTLSEGVKFQRGIEEPWDPDWRKRNSGAAVFLQDPETLAVYDAKTVFPLDL